jgi:hypothetical protein
MPDRAAVVNRSPVVGIPFVMGGIAAGSQETELKVPGQGYINEPT